MTRCPLTGKIINPFQIADQLAFCYETPETGRICFTDIALSEAYNLPPDEKQILAGIYRNKSTNKEKNEIITSAFLRTLKQQNIPYSFEARAQHFLKYLYDHGGKEYKSFDIDGQKDSYIAYASPEEFDRIMKYLKSENWVNPGQEFIGGAGQYHGLTLTKYGIHEIEKGQPKMPLVGLVNQEITTGDPSVDATISRPEKHSLTSQQVWIVKDRLVRH